MWAISKLSAHVFLYTHVMCTFSTMHHGKTVKRNATRCTFVDFLEGNGNEWFTSPRTWILGAVESQCILCENSVVHFFAGHSVLSWGRLSEWRILCLCAFLICVLCMSAFCSCVLCRSALYRRRADNPPVSLPVPTDILCSAWSRYPLGFVTNKTYIFPRPSQQLSPRQQIV